MKFQVEKSRLSGEVTIPASKSHTIRGLMLGTLADGTSTLVQPLLSSDTMSCIKACRAMGARVDDTLAERWLVEGVGGHPEGRGRVVDVGNSGTTLFLAMTAAALGDTPLEFTGDEQLRRRSAGPLLRVLGEMGAEAYSKGREGCPPLVVRGPIRGGAISIECPTSQYLSGLLIGCPPAEGDTEITVPLLNEKPYVEMTCAWLRELGADFEADHDLQHFTIPGRQSYPAFEKAIPADFSSAAFFLVAAAVTGSELFLGGLDMEDSQGDKAVVGMLESMGCEVSAEGDGVRIKGPDRLRGARFDLNATPDALPAMAVAGALAEGETALMNVPQARQKETDRISVMAGELEKMGAGVEELADGLVVTGGDIQGAVVDGWGDHRVVMALATAGLAAHGTTVVTAAEAASITFPRFAELMRAAGARLTETE